MQKAIETTEAIFKLIDWSILPLNLKKDKTFTIEDCENYYDDEELLHKFSAQLELIYLFETKQRRNEIFFNLKKRIEERLTAKEDQLNMLLETDMKGFIMNFIDEGVEVKLPTEVLIEGCHNSLALLREVKEEVEKYTNSSKTLIDSNHYPTLRLEVFAHNYKMSAYPDDFELRSGADWLRLKGDKGRIATVVSKINNKSKPTPVEFAKLIELLEDYPLAKKQVIADMNKF